VVANVLEVNPERLWDSLERSAEIGRFRDVGLRRLALSAEDKEMRDLFVDWARAAIPACRRSPSAVISTPRSAAAATTAFWACCAASRWCARSMTVGS
jgi:hypothetical protein